MLKIDKFKGNNVYALVDAILIREFLIDWINRNKNIGLINLFEGTVNSHIDKFSSPLLLDFSYLDILKIQEFVVGVHEVFPSLSIFSTDLDILKLSQKFKFMMFPQIDGKTHFFRFYDPLFFSKLNEIFSGYDMHDDFLDLYSLLDDFNNYKESYTLKRII